MEIGLLAAAALVVGIVIGLIARRRRADEAREPPKRINALPDRPPPSPTSVEEFHGLALEIDKTPEPCAAAGRLSGRIISPKDAPQLPLSECDAKVCRCLFRHRPELRRGERRKVEDRRDSVRFDPTKAERRTGKDRRLSVNIWKGRS